MIKFLMRNFLTIIVLLGVTPSYAMQTKYSLSDWAYNPYNSFGICFAGVSLFTYTLYRTQTKNQLPVNTQNQSINNKNTQVSKKNNGTTMNRRSVSGGAAN